VLEAKVLGLVGEARRRRPALARELLLERRRYRYALVHDFELEVVEPQGPLAEEDDSERDGRGVGGNVEDDFGRAPVLIPLDQSAGHVVEARRALRAVDAHP